MFDQILDRLKKSESYVSMGLGVFVVLVVGILIYRNFSQINRSKQQTKTETNVQITPEQKNEVNVNSILPAQYTVVAGDDLWIIAQKFYKDPYKWMEIAKVNNLSNPDVIHPGNILTIPQVMVPAVAGLPNTGINDEETSVNSTSQSNAITGNSYVVQKGDFLWEIAVRAYGDGFAVDKIIKANNIIQPNLVFSGDVLKIPR